MRRSALAALAVLAGLAASEVFLRLAVGLGDPVLYAADPACGYRPVPNQDVRRLRGSRVRVNNLGLRASRDWDAERADKVLFLGDSVAYGGSYIDTPELFSELAVRDLPGFIAGNAGVNAWGVENIHALVVTSGFTPARVYVTLLLENDFYRGLATLAGAPYWTRKPRLALQELIRHLLYAYAPKPARAKEPSGAERRARAGRAARLLKELDVFLAARGLVHLVFISPMRAQALGSEPKDPVVAEALARRGLRPVYIQDRLEALGLSREKRAALYRVIGHLEREGHALWAAIIGAELSARLRPREGARRPGTPRP